MRGIEYRRYMLDKHFVKRIKYVHTPSHYFFTLPWYLSMNDSYYNILKTQGIAKYNYWRDDDYESSKIRRNKEKRIYYKQLVHEIENSRMPFKIY